MKYGHLERIQVRLTVKGPLYIGSGEKLTAKEFILDNARHIVHVPSMPDMVNAFLTARQRSLQEDYIRFMTDANQKRLADFLTRHAIPFNPPPAWVRYSIQAQPEFTAMNGLSTFVKDAEGRAYIPGSSIKGAMRTALIAARMDETAKNALWRELEANHGDRHESFAEQTMRTLDCTPWKINKQTGLPEKDAVNDLLRALEISDSSPFRPEDMTVCRRHWLPADGEERVSRSPVFMECARPGAQAMFYLTIDHSLWPAGEDAVKTIAAALCDWESLCYIAGEKHFARLLADTACVEGAPIVLGGGTGFQRKSLVYRTRPYPEQAADLVHDVLRKQFTRRTGCTYKPPENAKTAPYMFKAAGYDGKLYPMGVCELSL